jgi:hypothetical protein
MDRWIRDQYELALRYWYFGGEWLAMGHLYMAVENLTAAVVRRTCETRGVNKEALAKSVGIVTNNPERPRWQPALDSWIRENVIFRRDSKTYQEAKSASDGLEHGFLLLSEVYRQSVNAISSTFEYVRLSVLSLLDVDEQICDSVARRSPKDVQSFRKVVRGVFFSDLDDIAAPDEVYPRLDWLSSIKDVRIQNDQVRLDLEEKLTVRCAEGVQFRGVSIQGWGRDEPGEPPYLLPAGEGVQVPVVVTATSFVESTFKLMASSRNFITSMSGDAQGVAVRPHMKSLFTALSLQRALSESIEVLLRDSRPVEAFPLVRSSIHIASRLEAFEELDRNAVDGLAIRVELDSLERMKSFYSEDQNLVTTMAVRQGALINLADAGNVAIPAGIPAWEASYFAGESADLLRFINEVDRWDEFTGSLHSNRDGNRVELRPTVVSPPFIVAIGSAVSRALVYSSVVVAETIGREYDLNEASRIDAMARNLESSVEDA